jgi:drug/metabolite transporter (DMT)-like permease
MPVAGVLSGAIVWGLMWYPYRVLQIAGISGPQATMISYLLAMLCGAFMLPRVWREIHRADGWFMLLLLSIGWTNLGYVLAMLHGEVMRVLLLFYLAPVWTILFSYWLLGERLNRYGYLVIVLALTGAFIMLWKPSLGVPFPQNFSEWVGLTAGISFALSNVVSRRATHLGVEVKTFSSWLGTALLTAPLLWWQGDWQMSGISADAWLILVLLGITICTVSFAVQYGVTHMPANNAMLLFLMELIVAAVSSYFLANEAMGLREWLGASLIVSASLLSGKLYTESK